MVEKHDTTDLAGTIAETLRSNPRCRNSGPARVANTVEVASSISGTCRALTAKRSWASDIVPEIGESDAKTRDEFLV